MTRNRDQSRANFQFSPRAVKFKFSPPGGLWCHLQIISSYWKHRYGRLDTLNIKIRPIVLILALLVHILATRWRWFHLQKVLDPSIMQERSIRSFRHLQHQNPLKSKKVCPCLILYLFNLRTSFLNPAPKTGFQILWWL